MTYLVERTPDGITIDGRPIAFEAARIGPREAHLRLGIRGHRVTADRFEGGWRLTTAGRSVDLRIEDERTRAIREMMGTEGARVASADLRAPMPGLVVRVFVQEGQAVDRGEPLVVVEAMKMENELRAGVAGLVSHVAVAAGDTVSRDDVLVRFAEGVE